MRSILCKKDVIAYMVKCSQTCPYNARWTKYRQNSRSPVTLPQNAWVSVLSCSRFPKNHAGESSTTTLASFSFMSYVAANYWYPLRHTQARFLSAKATPSENRCILVNTQHIQKFHATIPFFLRDSNVITLCFSRRIPVLQLERGPRNRGVGVGVRQGMKTWRHYHHLFREADNICDSLMVVSFWHLRWQHWRHSAMQAPTPDTRVYSLLGHV
jgi:hypothetical protein